MGERELYFMRDLKEYIVPYKSPFKKIRIGNEADGGYVIADIPCDVCYSYGSNDEISFEVSMNEKLGAKSFVYDHTIAGITNKPDYITFKKEGVSPEKTVDCNTIDSHLNENGSSTERKILKMDVEGSEWDSLYVCKELSRFDQLVVEFHFYRLHPIQIELFKKLTRDFKIIHLHANPFEFNPYIDIEFPKFLEVTFLRNDFFKEFEVDMDSKFPDPFLDPQYTKQIPDLQWWKRPYKSLDKELISTFVKNLK